MYKRITNESKSKNKASLTQNSFFDEEEEEDQNKKNLLKIGNLMSSIQKAEEKKTA
jgi:hypothetical protein